MTWKIMSSDDKKKYLYEFKKFFLDDLYFYWQLSCDNPVFIELEKSFNMSLKDFSCYIANKDLTVADVEQIQIVYRTVLKLVIHSIVTKCEHNHQTSIQFIKFLIEDN